MIYLIYSKEPLLGMWARRHVIRSICIERTCLFLARLNAWINSNSANSHGQYPGLRNIVTY